MAGELWRNVMQIGKETTAGTRVAATRKMFVKMDGSQLNYEREVRQHRFAVGSRSNVRAATAGVTQVSGSAEVPLSSEEIIELLLMGVEGGVTPTGASPYVWTFTPGNTLDSVTLEWDDAGNVWEAGGIRVNQLTFSGNVSGEASVSADLIGLNFATSTLTGSLTDRVPQIIEGWEAAMAIDSFGGTAGTTAVTGTLINWDVQISNEITRKYFASNDDDAAALAIGAVEVTATLTFEADASASATEWSNFDGVTQRLVQLEFGQNDVISGADKHYVQLNLPGAWTAVDLGGSDEGTRTYELTLSTIYDGTNAYQLEIICQNARASAY